jgi:hypothetical protein
MKFVKFNGSYININSIRIISSECLYDELEREFCPYICIEIRRNKKPQYWKEKFVSEEKRDARLKELLAEINGTT